MKGRETLGHGWSAPVRLRRAVSRKSGSAARMSPNASPPDGWSGSKFRIQVFKNAKPIKKERNSASLESIHDGKKHFKLEIEKDILKLYEELDKEKSENPMMDCSQRRLQKIRQLVERIKDYDNQNLYEIVSLKAKIVEVTEEHKIAMSLNAKNMHSVFKLHEKVLDDKTNELINTKQELQRVLVTNQELLQEIQELKTNKNTSSLESNLKIKPFSYKICCKAFHQVHEVKEHIKIHNPISEVEE